MIYKVEMIGGGLDGQYIKASERMIDCGYVEFHKPIVFDTPIFEMRDIPAEPICLEVERYSIREIGVNNYTRFFYVGFIDTADEVDYLARINAKLARYAPYLKKG